MFHIDRRTDTPAYLQLKRQIADKIEKHEFPVGSMLPSIRRLADLSDLSRATVEKAVKALVDDGYAVSRRGVGTLVRERCGLVLGITGGFEEETFFSDDYYLGITRGIECALMDQGVAFAFTKCRENAEETFAGFPVDGMIVFANTYFLARHEAALVRCAEKQKLMLISSAKTSPRFNCVATDGFSVTRKAVGGFLDRGLKDVAVFASDRKHERLDGCRQAYADRGMTLFEDRVFVYGRYDRGTAVRKLTRHVPEVVFDASAYVAGDLLDPVLDAAESGGHDLEILSFTPFSERRDASGFPVTHIMLPLRKMGEVAGRKLVDIIEGRIPEPARIKLQAEIVPAWRGIQTQGKGPVLVGDSDGEP